MDFMFVPPAYDFEIATVALITAGGANPAMVNLSDEDRPTK
jgi:hypothetical protein